MRSKYIQCMVICGFCHLTGNDSRISTVGAEHQIIVFSSSSDILDGGVLMQTIQKAVNTFKAVINAMNDNQGPSTNKRM